jgi:hypothetical protein
MTSDSYLQFAYDNYSILAALYTVPAWLFLIFIFTYLIIKFSRFINNECLFPLAVYFNLIQNHPIIHPEPLPLRVHIVGLDEIPLIPPPPGYRLNDLH